MTLLTVLLIGVIVLTVSTAAAIAKDARSGPLRIRGADISFTLQEERAGTVYRDGGSAAPIERILADHGATDVRIRVWVDPPSGSSDLATALTIARRAHDAGLAVILDLHYSDTWADHQRQETPSRWRGLDLPDLAGVVQTYTRETLAAFDRQGTPVDVVQVGNEISHGMLWPTGWVGPGDDADWSAFLTLLRAGVRGAHEGAPRARVMLHVDTGGDAVATSRFVDHVDAAGIRFDVIGLSYYPFWNGSLDQLSRTLDGLVDRYHRDVLVAETAYPWTLEQGDHLQNIVTSANQLPDGARFPPTPQGQAAYYEALRAVVANVPGGHGLGFLAWEPDWLPPVGWASGEGNHYANLSMFSWDGNGLPSLKSFAAP
ncbi:arabinogalactan endo-1,4-beta-galactosidase [Actinomycetospora endophytica]|uniref:Arabinogalactan endo-beta-1,4-galactanase n=1 Tax=Actinomycetospora endophytica TaxID=2291215 RepID=A0ABS8PE52_9PSEU|nr:glycosyl hydrolase 53 family protein [Actinomycetospora endophytica]MCD2196192.1 arabinogalactan endo-1,4-beta-galactosidase [Actinomycetospora endophytica]